MVFPRYEGHGDQLISSVNQVVTKKEFDKSALKVLATRTHALLVTEKKNWVKEKKKPEVAKKKAIEKEATETHKDRGRTKDKEQDEAMPLLVNTKKEPSDSFTKDKDSDKDKDKNEVRQHRHVHTERKGMHTHTHTRVHTGKVVQAFVVVAQEGRSRQGGK